LEHDKKESQQHEHTRANKYLKKNSFYRYILVLVCYATKPLQGCQDFDYQM